MWKIIPVFGLSAMLYCASLPAAGAELRIGTNDSVETVLAAQKDKRVTLRLRSGQEITGTVRLVTSKLVQLGAIGGKEFFDAVVPVAAVEAVIIRTRE